jgi:hypothetical protein
MYDFAKSDLLPDLDELRARLGKMSDKKLLRFGEAAIWHVARLCSYSSIS